MSENNYNPNPTAAPAANPTLHDPAADTLRERAEHAWQSTREQAETALHTGEDYVRENPMPVVLGALALGFVLGLACAPQREPETWKERYVDEPLDRTHGALVGAALAIAAACRHLFRSASDYTSETASAVRSQAKPLAKAAKRAGRKMHLS